MPIDPGTASLIGSGLGLAGGLLGGGGPKRNYSFGFSGSESFGQSGSASQQTSMSVQNPDTVWGVQSPYLADLYGQAQNIFQGGGNQAAAQEMWGANAEAMRSLLNPGPNPLMEVYQRQMQQGLEQNILPAIRREAMAGNMIGGTRQGVAEGMAAQEAINAQSEFAARLYNEDRNRQLGAMTQAPAMMQAGLGVPWYGANQLAGILGSPVVLGGGGFSMGQGTGSSFGVESGSSYSENASGSKGFVEETFPDRLGGGGGSSGGFSGGSSNRRSQR